MTMDKTKKVYVVVDAGDNLLGVYSSLETAGKFLDIYLEKNKDYIMGEDLHIVECHFNTEIEE